MNHTPEPFNPRLSDFPEDSLKIVTECLLKEQVELRKHIAGLKYYSNLSQMMREEIRDYELQLEQITEIVVQFHGALLIKEKERLLESN